MKHYQFVAYTLTCLVIVGFVYAVDDVSSNPILLTKCDNETAKLSCPIGKVISIQLANYGRFSVTPCNEEADTSLSITCFNDKTTTILKQRCEHKEECSFHVSSHLFGDSCPETSKYLEVNYNCVPAPATTTTTTTTPIPTTTTITEKEKKLNLDSKSGEIDNFLDDKIVKFCPSTHERHLHWPKTEAGKLARINCPAGTFGHAEWFCADSGEWSPKTGADLSQCISDFIQKLGKDVEDEAENLATQLETLKEIHSYVKRHQLIGGELIGIQSIVEKVVNNYVKIMKSTVFSDDVKRGYKINMFLMESMNRLLEHNGKDAWSDVALQKQREVASSLLVSAEKLLAAIFPTTSAGISETETESFVVKPNIIAQAAIVKVEDWVSFPSIPGDHDHVQIPREALESSGKMHAQVIYANYHGFGNYLKPLDIPPRKLVSNIVSVALVLHGKPQVIRRIARPIILEFRIQIEDNLRNPQCVWWDQNTLDWSTFGCEMKHFNGSHTICECNHLTHFAVLMNIHENQLPPIHDFILTIVTFVGCSISIFCLLLAFLCFFIFGESECERNSIHSNLSFTLAVAQLLFLYGIQKTDNLLTCSIIAIFMHYFFIAAFCWMFLEGCQIYFLLVQVFPPRNSRKPWYYLIGYSFPLLIVVGCFYLFPEGYGSGRYCWLSPSKSAIWGFSAPIAIILFLNFLFLFRTLYVVWRHSNVGYKPCKHDTDTIRNVRNWLKGSFTLIFLLGLTWIFGFFWIDQKTIWAAYSFTIFNSFQGFFILLFYVILNDKMHNDFVNWIRRNDWLPDCLRDRTIHEHRTGPYLPSTATSSAHCGTSGSCNGSEGMIPSSLIRKMHDSNYYSTNKTGENNDTQQEMFLTGQCPNCSHSTTILYSEAQTVKNYLDQHEVIYTPTLRRKQSTISTNYPGPQHWTLDGFGRISNEKIYRGSSGRGDISANYQTRISDESYDYATIPYEEAEKRVAYAASRGPQFDDFRHYRHEPYDSTHNAFSRAPPSFKPPPPPQISAPPMSDESAYSDSGISSSRSPNSGVSRNGTMLLRMDLSRNPPVFCEGV